MPGVDKAQLMADVRAALYCSKICSYAQGMNIIKAKSEEKGWGIDLGGLARIWKVRGAAGLLGTRPCRVLCGLMQPAALCACSAVCCATAAA